MPLTTTTNFIFFPFLFTLLSCLNAIVLQPTRRILHQPFFPNVVTSPPSPSPPPKLPFTSDSPFFPSPQQPPPPSTFASFPANVSSLDLPHSTSHSDSPKLVAVAIVAVIAAVLFSAAVVFWFCKRRKVVEDDKTIRSESSHLTVVPNPLPKVRNQSATSSDFLYLGTIVNSEQQRGGLGRGRDNNRSSESDSRKVDSPELRPLPELVRQQQQRSLLSGNHLSVSFNEEENVNENEEFYSPRGSLGRRSGSIGAGTSSRREFLSAVEIDTIQGKIGKLSSSSSSSSASSGSPARSASISISPPVSLSPRRPKSPELLVMDTPPLTQSQNLRPVMTAQFDLELNSSMSSWPVINNNTIDSPSFDSDRRLRTLPEVTTPLRVPGFVPPPPPPPPPFRMQWETPKPSHRKVGQSPSTMPPVPVTPSRPVVKSFNEASLMELPSAKSDASDNSEDTPKPKLKPLHWDKVRANTDREMVWDQLKSSSFKLNEEMIESLFVVNNSNSNPKETARCLVLPSHNQENQVLDRKKSQNIAILLKALSVTKEEVCEALLEGNAESLGTELLESLSKMAPTKEEERKLNECKDDSPSKFGVSERFLNGMLDIPFAFKRVDALLYVANFEPEVEYLKKSFMTLETACEELRSNRMFLKLLDAVLKTGNRMNVGTNRGDAHAFNLDTLLKLADVKGADGKTTLLHFVVKEIIKAEGARLSATSLPPLSTLNEETRCRNLGLQLVSSLASELCNVKKAATMDSDVLSSDVQKLSRGFERVKDIVKSIEIVGAPKDNKFTESMNNFMVRAEEGIIRIQAKENVAFSLVKEITEYFHGNSAKEEAHPFRIFMVVRDFLAVLDRVCKEVGTINERIFISSAYKFSVPVNPTLHAPTVFQATRQQVSSSGDENLSH